MRILGTNDDGVGARGLRHLARALADLGEVWIVAPDQEQSAASHALTLREPLRVTRHAEREFSVSGTPTDCVLVSVRGIRDLLVPAPDLVVSGINHGPNMGDDVTYSGTVAAAFEARLLGLPAVAFSNVEWQPRNLEASALLARQIVAALIERGLPRETLLNVNIPDRPLAAVQGFRVTRLGLRVYRDEIVAKVDPRGRPYYWIGGEPPIWESHDASDFSAVSEGFVSVTPLQTDWTDHPRLEQLRAWHIALPGRQGLGAMPE
jgi:5'-nucleotidase